MERKEALKGEWETNICLEQWPSAQCAGLPVTGPRLDADGSLSFHSLSLYIRMIYMYLLQVDTHGCNKYF